MNQVANCLLLCLEHGGDIFPRNAVWLATNYTALYPRRNMSSMLCCFEKFLADSKFIKITPRVLLRRGQHDEIYVYLHCGEKLQNQVGLLETRSSEKNVLHT
jgi:hypothetical protein